MVELERLQTQLSELKRRALDVGAAQTSEQQRLTNAVLRDALRQQLEHFTDAQVLFSEYGVRPTRPAGCYASLQRLRRDPSLFLSFFIRR